MRYKMELGIALLIGAIVGAGSFFLGTKSKDKDNDNTAQTQQEVIKQLTDLDIVKDLCKPENTSSIESRLLCRELSCLIYSRGIDSQTSGKQCEEISNIQNSIVILNYCKERFEDTTDCYNVFYRRK